MKILAIDIETTPNLAYVWGLWDQNVGLSQLVESTEMLCFVAKWVGEPDSILFRAGRYSPKHETWSPDQKHQEMVLRAWELLDEADAVLHYNGKRFDVPHLNREFLLLGLGPPSPYRQIDLLETVKRQFKFPSNKLDYATKVLGFPGKVKVDFDLWTGCMSGDREAWSTMEAYNCRDVTEMEKLYEKLKPWIVGHPNAGIDNGVPVCPTCGSAHVQRRGFAYTPTAKFQQFHCQDCGRWSRSTRRVPGAAAALQPVVV
ncbi:MAG: ribonuclease H-like domain-containing protein [Candidatus Dormibacteria bacterium]